MTDKFKDKERGFNPGGILSKVIDLTARRSTTAKPDEKNNLKKRSDFSPKIASPHLVVDFEEQKKKIVQQERRTRRRTVLNEMMSSMAVIPERGLLKVMLHDISDGGLSFDTLVNEGAFAVGEEITLRIYINHKTYFPVHVTVRHVSEQPTLGTLRHGATLKKDASNDVVLQYFVKFIEAAASLMKKDNGDLMVNKIS